MPVEKYCWKRPKGVQLYGKLWTPESNMRSLVVLVHGIGEHGGCYDDWAEKFTEHSVGLLTFDLRGHGRSSGKRGHACLNDIQDDLKSILKSMRKKFPKIPVILFGHSMGGQIVLSYATKKNVKVQGIIASSPWLQLVHPPARILIKAAKILSSVFPSLTVRTGVKAGNLAHSGASTRSTKTDPLLHKKISLKLFTDLQENGETILRNKHRINIPLLLMHGDADRLTSYKASRSLAQNAGEFTEYKQWEGMYHDLHTDTNNDAVFGYILQWISKSVEKNGTVQNTSKMYRVA